LAAALNDSSRSDAMRRDMQLKTWRLLIAVSELGSCAYLAAVAAKEPTRIKATNPPRMPGSILALLMLARATRRDLVSACADTQYR
jgi:hypothetical protein